MEPRTSNVELPSREELIGQMTCIKQDVGLCVRDAGYQRAQVKFAIAGSSGHAKLVALELEEYFEHSLGRRVHAWVRAQIAHCVEHALARVHFAPFKKTFFTATVSFPFRTVGDASDLPTYTATAHAALTNGRRVDWRAFRDAVKTFSPTIRASDSPVPAELSKPLANYLKSMHRKIHRGFVFAFLRGLPPTGPFGDQSLHTEIEIAINADGTTGKIGIAESSGYLPFDYGVFDSVTRAAPFAPPPLEILSGDRRLYLRWGFYRNERECDLFNVHPYILRRLPPGLGPEEPIRDPLPGDVGELLKGLALRPLFAPATVELSRTSTVSLGRAGE